MFPDPGIESIDLFAYLKSSTLYPKIFWSSRDHDLAVAAVGIAQCNNSSALRFGWRHFTPAIQREWRDFAPSYFFIPRFVVTQKNQKEHIWKNRFRMQRITSLPSRAEWISAVSKALKAIENKQFKKVVLARRVCIDCSEPIDPIALCQSIHSIHQTVFLIQPTPTSAFVGASPEMLFQRRGRMILCDVLAGTRLLKQQNELLVSEKDRREFFIVQQQILEALSPHCQSPLRTSNPTIRASSKVCHIYSQITGDLKKGVTDNILLDTLHPTPAVGGNPSTEALEFLKNHEPFDRGLYAAPLGWTTPDHADFAVGIRSCLIQNNRAHLYAGTGIVKGSDPLQEWEESEQKLSHWNSFITDTL
jgi:menaquinone-specific isochorismate synthase